MGMTTSIEMFNTALVRIADGQYKPAANMIEIGISSALQYGGNFNRGVEIDLLRGVAELRGGTASKNLINTLTGAVKMLGG